MNTQLEVKLDRDKLVTALTMQYQNAYTNEQEALTQGDIPTVYYWQGKQAGILDAGTAVGVNRDVIRSVESRINGKENVA